MFLYPVLKGLYFYAIGKSEEFGEKRDSKPAPLTKEKGAMASSLRMFVTVIPYFGAYYYADFRYVWLILGTLFFGSNMNNSFRPALTAPFKQHGRLLLTGLVLAILASNPAIAADDSYLNQLNTEAASSASPTTEADRKKINQQKFEDILKLEKPSTYELYSKLSDDHKMEVVKDYAARNRLSRSSGLIAELYFKEK